MLHTDDVRIKWVNTYKGLKLYLIHRKCSVNVTFYHHLRRGCVHSQEKDVRSKDQRGYCIISNTWDRKTRILIFRDRSDGECWGRWNSYWTVASPTLKRKGTQLKLPKYRPGTWPRDFQINITYDKNGEEKKPHSRVMQSLKGKILKRCYFTRWFLVYIPWNQTKLWKTKS